MTVVSADGLFEWDDEKAARNLAKHGVSFEEASEAISDPFGLDSPDLSHSIDEDRRITIGLTERRMLVMVVQTERLGRISIVSARRAVAIEMKRYAGR